MEKQICLAKNLIAYITFGATPVFRRLLQALSVIRILLLIKSACKFYTDFCLQCFDAVGWAAGRASSL